MQNNDNNFLDSKTILAIVLAGLVWFGWQSYLNKKYPHQNQQAEVVTTIPEISTTKSSAAEATLGAKNETGTAVNTTTNTNIEKAEEQLPATVGGINFSFSTKGMAVKNVTLSSYKEKDGTPIVFSGLSTGIFALLVDGKPVDLSITKISDTEFKGTGTFEDLTFERKVTVDPARYVFESKILVNGPVGTRKITIATQNEKKTYDSGHFLFPSYEFQEFYLVHEAEKSERLNITRSKEDIQSNFKLAKVASIDTHYFTAGLVDQSEVIPDASVTARRDLIEMNLNYSPLGGKDQSAIQFIGYVGPRDLKILEKADPALVGLVNFGFFSFIAKPLLKTMQWFHSIVGNWGIAIILLTLLVRMIVLPLHMMSFRSMKAMQKVQPLINSLREKHKEDPTTLNREMMDLMRQHKVNPLGGCLPMLLQIPVFFALYQVFGQSIDLYQAPFTLWIHDLSLKDPFYVLPVLMSIVMFIQQKITPTTMDPTQAKIMAFMPIIFSIFMLSLPSALTLYMFVSTLFGVIQQYLFLRDKNATPVIKAAKA